MAWSRIFSDREVLCAINTDPGRTAAAWVTIDASLHSAGAVLSCVYRSGPGSPDPLPVTDLNGRAVRLALPPGGVAVYAGGRA